jgi:D-glycero-D-manno-heptose 1,7-bisphosphate phosphatase
LALSKGYVTCVVTNQAGIACGYYSELDFSKLTSWLCDQSKAEGLIIDKGAYQLSAPPTTLITSLEG